MKLKIYDKSGVLKLVVSPADSSTHQHAIQEDNVLNLSFTTTEYMLLDVNDYVDFDSVRFRMMEQYVPQQKSTVEWSYTCRFYGYESLIRRGLILKLVDNEMQPVFSLTAPASQHMKLIVDNINRIFNTTDFKVGEVIATENLVMEYNSTTISEGLSKLSEEAETEWWFDGLTLNLIRCEHGQEITLGYWNGLTKLERTTANNVQFFTRLFPLGSTRNIDVLRYGHNRLQLPDNQKYVEQNVEAYGIIEHSEEAAFSHIYPRRVGVISAVRSEERTGQDGNLFKIYYFKDADIPFDPNDYEIAELVKQVTFESGELNGRDFEVNYHSNTKEFEIITQFPDHSDQLPNDILTPEVGNKYVLWNIRMPDEYYTLAEQEFKTAVDAYMLENNLDKSVYKAPTDYIEIAKQGIHLSIGRRIRLESEQFFPGTGYRTSRITRISRKVNEPTQMDIEISDVLSKGKITELANTVQNIKTIIEGTRAGLPEVVKSYENTPASDYNIFSSLKSVRSFVSKLYNDVVQGIITFVKGAKFGNYEPGTLGSGGAILIDENGNSVAEFDFLKIRKKATFTEITVQELRHVGGELIVSPAAMVCSRVEEYTDYYRCFFETTDPDGRTIYNQFTTGDQARCQTFNLEKQADGSIGNHYYWRLVIATGDNYIDLSKSDCYDRSDVPAAGDNIAQLGNRTDKSRQNAQVISAYGPDAPSYKQYAGINSYSLVDKEETKLSPGDNRFSGKVNIQEGSTGWENLEGLPDAFNELTTGAVNLVRNSGFRGNYETVDLEVSTSLNAGTELYSPSMEFWQGNSQAIEDENSRSGYSCTLAGTSISQSISGLIAEEGYVLSLKVKGTLRLSFAGLSETINENEYTVLVFKTQAISSIHTLEISGTGQICEIQLERGTIKSDWNYSPLDNDKTLSEFLNIKYLTDSIRNASTSIIGGLILSNIINLGNYVDGTMKNVTAGMSGVYNDDNDVAFWAGGDMKKAIKTVMKFMDDPNVQLSDEEWRELANVVITHGGRGIFNDVVLRGYIYALGGVFRGRIEANEGYITGKLESSSNGNRVVVDPTSRSIRLMTSNNQIVGEFSFYELANRKTGRIQLREVNEEGVNSSLSSLTANMLYMSNRGNNFQIIVGPSNTFIEVNNLPATKEGLDPGMIWRDGETLKIVTQ